MKPWSRWSRWSRWSQGLGGAVIVAAAAASALGSRTPAEASSRIASRPTLQVSVRRQSSTKPQYKANIEVPKVQWKLRPTVARRVNALIDTWANQEVRRFAAQVVAHTRASHNLPKSLPASTLTIRETTTLVTDRILSLAFEITPYYRGEASPGQIPAGLTFSLKTGDAVELRTLFRQGTHADAALARIALAGLKNFRPASAHCYVGGKPSPGDIRAWWVSPKGLVLAFPAGLYTAAYCGPATITVKPAAIRDILGHGASSVL